MSNGDCHKRTLYSGSNGNFSKKCSEREKWKTKLNEIEAAGRNLNFGENFVGYFWWFWFTEGGKYLLNLSPFMRKQKLLCKNNCLNTKSFYSYLTLFAHPLLITFRSFTLQQTFSKIVSVKNFLLKSTAKKKLNSR